MQESEQKAKARIGVVKEEYAKKEKELNSKLGEVKRKEFEASYLVNNYQNKIKEEAERQTAAFKNKLQEEFEKKVSSVEKQYKSKTDNIYCLTLVALLYGFFATVLTAYLSERFSEDFVKFLSTIWAGISGIFNLAVSGALYTWTIKNIIPYDYVDVIVAVLLTAIVFILIAGILYGLIGFGLYKFCNFYKEEFCDITSLIVALVSMAILVWFADYMSFIPLNMVLIWIIIHGIYLLIRMITSTSKSSSY